MNMLPANSCFFYWRVTFHHLISVLLVLILLNYHAIIIILPHPIIVYGGGELQVHEAPEVLGDVIKSARHRANITVEALAEKIGKSERYIYRIENENKKPSFDVLYQIVRELTISPDEIFYPERPSNDSEMENLLRMLYVCDERSMQIIKATLKAAINSQPDKLSGG